MGHECEDGGKSYVTVLALHPSAPFEPIKEAFYTYLYDVRDMCESYAEAAQLFSRGSRV